MMCEQLRDDTQLRLLPDGAVEDLVNNHIMKRFETKVKRDITFNEKDQNRLHKFEIPMAPTCENRFVNMRQVLVKE